MWIYRVSIINCKKNLETPHCLAKNNEWSWSWFNRHCSCSERSKKLMPSCKVPQLPRVKARLWLTHLATLAKGKPNPDWTKMMLQMPKAWWYLLCACDDGLWPQKFGNVMGCKHRYNFFLFSDSREIKLNAKMHQLNLIGIRRLAPFPRILV